MSAAGGYATKDGKITVSYQGWDQARLCSTGNSSPLSFYATKDGKVSVSYQGWDQSKVVLDG